MPFTPFTAADFRTPHAAVTDPEIAADTAATTAYALMQRKPLMMHGRKALIVTLNIVEDRQAALAQFAEITNDLKK